MPLHFLIADQMHESIFPALDQLGISYDNKPAIDRQGVKSSIDRYDGLIIRSKTFVDADLLGLSKKLRVVCRAGAGIDNLDVDFLNKRDIHIINAPEGNRDAVAEHCIGMLLGLLNKITLSDRQVRQGIWNREANRGTELKDKVVGIIGYGNMGSAFAERLKSFGCEIIAYDKYKAGFEDEIVAEVSLEEIYEKAEVVSLHVPLTEETRFWINEGFIEKFKHPIYLINTSRGEIISLETLVKGLKSTKIIGAALDVFENEKLGRLTKEQKYFFDYIIKAENVILTPHVAGWSKESYKRINTVIIEKLHRWINNIHV